MYLVYQNGIVIALCLTKTSANDIVDFTGEACYEKIEPVDLDQFVKNREPILPIVECSKCGAKGVAFICDEKGCPVSGGAAHN